MAAAWVSLGLCAVSRATRFFEVLGVAVLAVTVLRPVSIDVGPEETLWVVGIHVRSGLIILGLLPWIVPVVTRRRG